MAKVKKGKTKFDAPINFRAVILARLEKIGRTRNWLAERQKVVSHGSAREFLYGYGQARREGGRDPKGSTIAEMLRILGLELKPIKGYKPEIFDSGIEQR